jgi:hypothetical protein
MAFLKTEDMNALNIEHIERFSIINKKMLCAWINNQRFVVYRGTEAQCHEKLNSIMNSIIIKVNNIGIL